MPSKRTAREAGDPRGIADRLRSALAERGLSHRAFHLALGAEGYSAAQATVNRQLTGKSKPNPKMLSAAIRVLDVRPGWLFLGDGPPVNDFPEADAPMSGAHARDLARADDWLTKKVGETIADAVLQAIRMGFATRPRLEALVRLDAALRARGLTRASARAPVMARAACGLVAVDRELSVDQSNRGAYAAWADDVLAVVVRHAPASEHSTTEDDA